MSIFKPWAFKSHIGLLLLGALGAPSFAAPAKTRPATKPVKAKPARPSSSVGAGNSQYLLGPDDVISVTVLGKPQLSNEQITIPSSGHIDLPTAGTIRVAGRTTRDVALAITRSLGVTMVDPEVTVSLRTQRPRQVFVSGAIAKTGVYDIKPNWRVSEALTAAGGVTGRADEATATLARGGIKLLDINVQTIQDNPASPQNVRLLPGDSLIFSSQPRFVTVSGAVVKPDIYPLGRAPRLLDAINAAGDTKDPDHRVRITLVRRGKTSELNLQEALVSPEANIRLENNDLISVETIPALQVTVTGPFIKNAGNFQLAPDSGVAQAIAQAGGLTVPAEQVVAGVRRGAKFIPVDLMRAGVDPSKDIPLQSGDLVVVNEPDIIRVQVTGTVTRPGELRLPPRVSLREAIARAGGLGIKPEEARISVLRTPVANSNTTGEIVAAPRQTSLQVDAVALFSQNDLRQNVVLQEGDLVSVTQVQNAVVIVTGEVKTPGPYTIKEGEGLAELIARAGGQTAEASLSRVVLKRGTDSQTVDVYNAVTLGQKSDVTLQSGDFVVVPRNEARVIVMQAVQRPGNYAIPENRTLTVTDALGLAGGPRDRATIKEVALLRPNPRAENGVERRIVSLEKIYKGDLRENVALQNGDVIYVPEAKAKGSLLGGLGAVINTLIGIRFLGS